VRWCDAPRSLVHIVLIPDQSGGSGDAQALPRARLKALFLYGDGRFGLGETMAFEFIQIAA
jgi:hypothetical protein